MMQYVHLFTLSVALSFGSFIMCANVPLTNNNVTRSREQLTTNSRVALVSTQSTEETPSKSTPTMSVYPVAEWYEIPLFCVSMNQKQLLGLVTIGKYGGLKVFAICKYLRRQFETQFKKNVKSSVLKEFKSTDERFKLELWISKAGQLTYYVEPKDYIDPKNSLIVSDFAQHEPYQLHCIITDLPQ
jgi:hypothetical protein